MTRRKHLLLILYCIIIHALVSISFGMSFFWGGLDLLALYLLSIINENFWIELKKIMDEKRKNQNND